MVSWRETISDHLDGLLRLIWRLAVLAISLTG